MVLPFMRVRLILLLKMAENYAIIDCQYCGEMACCSCARPYPLSKNDEAYEQFKNKRDEVIKIAVEC